MSHDAIRDHAALIGFTRKIWVSDGSTDLTLYVHPDADLDGRFKAICADEGDMLAVNGWLMCDCEDVDDVAAAA